MEAIVGGVVGTAEKPPGLICGRRDERGRLRYVGWSAGLTVVQQREIAQTVTPAGVGERT